MTDEGRVRHFQPKPTRSKYPATVDTRLKMCYDTMFFSPPRLNIVFSPPRLDLSHVSEANGSSEPPQLFSLYMSNLLSQYSIYLDIDGRFP